MIIETLYRLQIDTQVQFEESDEEICRALISSMQDMASLLGFKVLTYRLISNKLMLLVSARSRSFPMSIYAAAEEKEPGSGKVVLYEKLSKHLNEAGVQQMNKELNELAKQEEEDEADQTRLDVAVQRIARRVGNPQKFLQQIEWSFLKWIQENRPHLYPEPVEEDEDAENLDDEEAENPFLVTQLGANDSLCDIAMQMDRIAVENDQGLPPQSYWCGYADALRGDHRALDGLKKLTDKPNANSIQELGYPAWLSENASAVLPDLSEAEDGAGIVQTTRENVQTELARDSVNEAAVPSVVSTADLADEAAKNRGGVVILVMAFIFMLGICASAAYYIHYKESKKHVPVTQVAAEQVDPLDQKRESGPIINDLKNPEAVRVAEEFVKSSDPNVRLELCRDPDIIANRLLSYPAKALDTPAEKVIPGSVIQFPGISHRRFVATFSDGTSRQLWVVPTVDGLRVDWDSYARYNTATWPELLDGTKKVAEIRVLAIKRPYYNYGFRDEEEWLCCELTSLDYEGSLYGYVKRGTKAAKLLNIAANEPGKGPPRAFTLRISSTAESYKQKQFKIDRVLALGWVRGEQDVEELWVPPVLDGDNQ